MDINMTDVKRVKINGKEVKFHIVNKTIIFDEPIATEGVGKMEIEATLNEAGTKALKGIFFCS